MLRELCRQYTNLTDQDINQLKTMAEMLDYFSELSDADIFIDCFDQYGETGVVVAHGRPGGRESLYSGIVVGQKVLPQNEPTVFSAYKSGMVIRDAKGITQENRIVMQRAVPIQNPGGKLIGILIEERDMTRSIYEGKKLAQLEKAAEELNRPLLNFQGNSNLITNHVRDGILVFDHTGTAVYANPEAKRIYNVLGFGENLVGLSYENLSLDYRMDDAEWSAIEKEKGVACSDEENCGEENCLELTLGEMELIVRCKRSGQGEAPELVLLLEDVSDLKKKEKELVLKSVAVQEIHHRIKNNLQTIVSILNLQARRSSSDETKGVIRENISRINSIAVIHEALTNNGVDEQVSLLDMLEKMKAGIRDYAVGGETEIEICILGEDLTIEGETAVQIAIVINELISNSMQHAFKGRDRGRITLRIGEGMMYRTICAEDDGVGFDLNQVRQNSLGLGLVEITVKERLGGTFRITSNGAGTKACFDFKA